MTFRLLVLALAIASVFVGSPDGWAIDCVIRLKDDKVEVSKLDVSSRCSGLRVLRRSSPDIKPNAGALAVYVEFKKPNSTTEHMYNEWVNTQVDRLYFGSRGEVLENQTSTEFLLVDSIYLSKRILSARYEYSVCCGAHGSSEYRSINIDVSRGVVQLPGDLFRLYAVANFCWRQFARIPEKFAPYDEFTEEDLREPPSRRRSSEFLGLLEKSESWSFTSKGARVEFGFLYGYAAGPYGCVLDNAALKSMARSGVAVPP